MILVAFLSHVQQQSFCVQFIFYRVAVFEISSAIDQQVHQHQWHGVGDRERFRQLTQTIANIIKIVFIYHTTITLELYYGAK